ncbi:uncharacterized protein [Lepidochelys kempii]|uniref:uncharacterized protein n=1 Tax=Lepidochelys kempii TaxID=8472 RepID=UPI003C6F6583
MKMEGVNTVPFPTTVHSLRSSHAVLRVSRKNNRTNGNSKRAPLDLRQEPCKHLHQSPAETLRTKSWTPQRSCYALQRRLLYVVSKWLSHVQRAHSIGADTSMSAQAGIYSSSVDIPTVYTDERYKGRRGNRGDRTCPKVMQWQIQNHSKRSPTWTTAGLLDLLSIWGEDAVQSQLYLSHRNFDTYGHISRGLCEKGYDQDTVQCRAKIKELRQAYHKANHCSGASPKTCQFYKELDAIFGSDPTTKSTVDILAGLEAVERGPNLEKVVIDEEVELDNHMELLVRSPGGAGSQELFTTPELSSNSQQLLSSEQEAGEETPDVAFRNTPTYTPAECLRQIRKCPRPSKEDMFRAILHCSNAEKRERKA